MIRPAWPLSLLERISHEQRSPKRSDNTTMNSNETVISAQGLTKVFKDFWGRSKARAVDDVDFEVKRGEVFGLLGPNGAGKTTSFNMIVGLVKPEEGEVVFEGKSIGNLPMHQRARLGIGYLTQEPSVFRKLTVEQNILAIL